MRSHRGLKIKLESEFESHAIDDMEIMCSVQSVARFTARELHTNAFYASVCIGHACSFVTNFCFRSCSQQVLTIQPGAIDQGLPNIQCEQLKSWSRLFQLVETKIADVAIAGFMLLIQLVTMEL